MWSSVIATCAFRVANLCLNIAEKINNVNELTQFYDELLNYAEFLSMEYYFFLSARDRPKLINRHCMTNTSASDN